MSSKIGIKQVLAMQPGTIIWDGEVRGFNARRQFSEVVTFSVYFRTQEGQQRFFKIGRYPVFAPKESAKRPYASFKMSRWGKTLRLKDRSYGARQSLTSYVTIMKRICSLKR